MELPEDCLISSKRPLCVKCGQKLDITEWRVAYHDFDDQGRDVYEPMEAHCPSSNHDYEWTAY